MTRLNDVKVGQKFMIADFLDAGIKCLSSRFGLDGKSIITCIAKPGPIVVKRNHQEIAIGKNMSKNILVNLL